MAIVIEVLNRGGNVINSKSFESGSVSIGRGLNNDFIVHDPHADADHLRIEQDETTHNFYCEDQKTLNGVWLLNSKKPGKAVTLKNKTRLAERKLFYSGQQFLIGRTVVRVFSSEHPVVSPLPLSSWEEVGLVLSHWWVWLGALIGIVGLQSYNGYLNNPMQENVFQYILPSGYAVIGALFFAGLWAFVGRNLRHESRFTTHFSIALIAILATTVVSWVLPLLVYNMHFWWAYSIVDKLVGAIVVFCVGMLTLLYATGLKPMVRFLVALVVPVAMLLSLFIDALTDDDFQPMPPYEISLVAPHWQWRGSIDTTVFLRKTQNLYEPSVGLKRESSDDFLSE